eukprot:TRINITY_DN2892_c0_g1_i4.p1 TRINITY_DN2892_c0_g1~~TRINITY_DN2892_c0_g1_i4.p1  ORF type:complete len:182 (-),score=8.00 TRINITY_DN2892_c0_g1_i4:215-760(-)
MGVWMRVADPSCKYSEFRTNLDKVDTRGPLEEMQRHGPAVGKRSLRTLSVHEHHKAETVAHLSNQAAAALALSSGEEYAMWTRALVKKLCETADSDRLRDICENLLYSDPYEVLPFHLLCVETIFKFLTHAIAGQARIKRNHELESDCRWGAQARPCGEPCLYHCATPQTTATCTAAQVLS